MQFTLNSIEQFLFNLEQNEKTVFSEHPDYFIYPLIPFFQIVHVLNIEDVLTQLNQIEVVLGGYLIRVDGYLVYTCSEFGVREEDLRRLTIQLLEIMRF